MTSTRINLAKGKKNVTLTVRVEENIKKIFEEYCEKEGRQYKWVLTTALRDFLRKENYIK
jgi:predicted transcriptional regulator